jgi:hypothetical protein
MKKVITVITLAVMLVISTTAFAQDRNFKDGSVWQVGLIKSSANMSEDYLISLKSSWVAVHEEALKQGLILSYKVLSGAAANPGDWDIMLMTEYKNMASTEGLNDKWDAIEKKVLGSEEAMKKLNETRVNMRTIYGGKLLREIVYK